MNTSINGSFITGRVHPWKLSESLAVFAVVFGPCGAVMHVLSLVCFCWNHFPYGTAVARINPDAMLAFFWIGSMISTLGLTAWLLSERAYRAELREAALDALGAGS